MTQKILIVGAGFYGSVCARVLTDAGHHCTVIEKRDHIGGNCFSREIPEAGCHQHVYGPHIFHTSDTRIWEFVNRFAAFNHFVNRPKVNYQGRVYSFPINLFTLYQLFGVSTPAQAEQQLAQRRQTIDHPRNLEDWCLSQVGSEIYTTFIRGYTRKQWQKDPKHLPASIIRRLPIRLNYDDNYFTDRYQGIPIGGYTALFTRLLDGIPVELEVDFLADRDLWLRRFDHIIYTGPIDALLDYSHGVLEYRSLRFVSELLEQRDFQGNAVFNYTEESIPYTRIVEHKHFDLNLKQPHTLITYEFPCDWQPGQPEFYPINTDDNQALYKHYRDRIAALNLPISIGGRLGAYRYYDMHQVIGAALSFCKQWLTA